MSKRCGSLPVRAKLSVVSSPVMRRPSSVYRNITPGFAVACSSSAAVPIEAWWTATTDLAEVVQDQRKS